MDISFKNVYKSFGKTPMIKDLTFTVQSGDIVCLLGPSGAGKTTIIRLLIGAIAADKGTIKIGDAVIPDLKVIQNIGFMPQNDAMYDDLSGENNLRFFAELYGMRKREAAQRIDAVLRLVELSADRKKFVGNYSGGMKKRLSLAVALLHEPNILMLDEPTVGIDPVLRRTIWNQFKELKNSGRTLIVSTHVMDEVSECDKGALIYNGELIQYDSVEKLLSRTTNGKVEELFFMAAERKGGKAV
jgi:ABC-2 type transport system ATP-binding protein